MIISIKKIILESLQDKIKHKVIVYGEAHFHRDEVDRIRNDIIKLKPDIIIHELPEDYKFYKIHLPSTRFYQLDKMPPKVVVIVVGDTHLRTIQTPELGKASPFYKYNFNIIRSKYPEIN